MKKITSDVDENEYMGQPLDPTSDPQSMMNDTTGLTGLSSSPKKSKQMPPLDTNDDGLMLSANDPTVRGKVLSTSKLDDLDEVSESEVGDDYVSGDMPDIESDDDTLANSHQVGLRLDEDYDNPQPLDIAADIAAAEAERHGTSDVDEDDDDYNK